MPRIIKIIILLLLLSSLLGIVIFTKSRLSPKPEKQEQKTLLCTNCNVILISVDTLRADRLGIYGYSKDTSPNINEFFKNDLIFENAYSQAPWTLPSYASLLTSNYPNKLFVEMPTDILSEKFLTLPQVLKNNGYYTTAIEGGEFFTKDHGFSQGFDQFTEIKDWSDGPQITKNAEKILSEIKDKKFFLFLRPFEVHDPYIPPPPWDKKIDPGYKGDIDFSKYSTLIEYHLGKLKLNQADLTYMASQYDGEVAYLDSLLGGLFKTINELDLSKNTLIILTADHGEEFGERGMWGMHNYSLYDELVKVPLLIKIPGQNLVGRIKPNVSLLDLSPTILNLLNLQPQKQFLGKSLLTLISNPEDETAVFAETRTDKKTTLAGVKTAYENFIKTGNIGIEPKLREEKLKVPKSVMVRQKEWKLIKNFDNSFELYNLKDDPAEKHNLKGTGLEIENVLKEKLANF